MLEKGEKIIALWMSGSEQAQIAEEVGVSPQTVSNIVNKLIQHGDVFPWKAWLEGTNTRQSVPKSFRDM